MSLANHTIAPAQLSDEPSPSARIGHWAATLSVADVPASIRERVMLLLIDTIASALAGRDSAERAQVEATAVTLAPGATGGTVIAGPALSPIGAAFVNGYQITAANLCDVYRPSLCHVTPEVVPPALAAAEGRGISGGRLITALAAGLETVVRVGDGLDYAPFRERGWHSPGVIGPLGGAVAAGSVQGLSSDELTRALSLAGSQSAGTFAQWGTPGVKFHQARGAMAGLIAATLAGEGFAAAAEILTAPDGGLLTTYSDGGNPAALTAGLGESWTLEQISVRLWPAASSLQGALSVAFDLIAQEHVRPDDIRALRMHLHPTTYDLHGEMSFDNRFRALLSTRYCTSVILHDRSCWLEQFTAERVGDPVVRRFAEERISVFPDPQVALNGARLEVELVDGRVVGLTRAIPHGDPADPASLDEVVDKFRRSARSVLSNERAERALDLLLSIEELADVDLLLAQLRAAD